MIWKTRSAGRRWCVALALVAGLAWGEETPRLRVPVLSRAPTVDGVLAEGEWQEAAEIEEFRHFRSGEASQYRTRAWLGIDGEFVYVAFECGENEMGKLASGKLAHDSMALFARDHVELFLMPDALEDVFYHFSIDTSGNRHDERGSDGGWDGKWKGAARLGESGWAVEIRIPRAEIGLKEPRMALANLCRTRRIAPGETSAWSPTFGPFHNPARFGRLVFGPASEARIASLSLIQPEVGQNRVEVAVANAPAGAGVRGYLIRDGQARVIGSGSVPNCAFPLKVERDTEADVLVALERDGQVLDFRSACGVRLSGSQPMPIRQVLGTDASPAMRWIGTERLRGISYLVASGSGMADDGLEPGELSAPQGLHLRGESFFRIRAKAGEPIRAVLTAEAGESVFTQSVYALFGPQGKMLDKGVVEAGKTREIQVRAAAEGTHVLLINSGPAMWNPFTITVGNPHWVLDARGKSQYIGTPVAYHSLRDCKLAGCNLALMAAWAWNLPFGTDAELAQWRAKLEELAGAAQAADIRLIPYLGWGCSRYDCDSVPKYTRALTRLSVRGPQPCPASREYWEGSFLRRALVMAELSKTYPCVVGAGLDPESYYFSSWYTKHLKTEEERKQIWSVVMPIGGSPEKCVCNDCLRSCLEAKGMAVPDLPEDAEVRFDWLAERGLLKELFAHQEGKVEGIAADMRQRLQAVNPDFCFAIMHLSTGDDWFRRGMARGLGTARIPVLDFDEGTYTSGYSEKAVEEKLDRYRAWNAQVVHGGTLWMLRHPPANPHFLAAQMYNFALHGHSYWVWPGSMSLWRDGDKVHGYYSLSGYAEDYWASIALANAEIDRRLAAPETYRSPLERIERRPQIPEEPKGSNQNEWAKKPYYPVHVYAGTRLSFVVPAGTKKVRIAWGYRQPLGRQTLAVGLGGTVRETTADVKAEEASVLEVDAPAAGGMGWLELRTAGRPACIGVRIEGAKPFFGTGDAPSLR